MANEMIIRNGLIIGTVAGTTAIDRILDEDTLTSNSATALATQQSIKAYVDSQITGLANVMTFKGTIDASANPNYPAGDAGDMYVISVAGKIGGASGENVEAGDQIVCLVDSTASGDQATVGANWNIVQKNIDGAVTGDTSSTDNAIARFDGTTGKVVQNSLVTIDDNGTINIPTGQMYQINGTDLALTDLGDTPSAYVAAGGVLVVNGTTDGVVESGIVLNDGTANSVNISNGTGSIVVTGASVAVNSNLAVDAAVDINSAVNVDGVVDIDANLTVTASTTLDQDLQQSASVTFAAVSTGSVTLTNGAVITDATASVGIATVAVDTFADTAGDGAEWVYVAKNGANIRTGKVLAAWDATGDTVSYAEYSTGDVGDTSPVTFAVAIDAGNVKLNATSTSAGWTVNVTRVLL